MPEPLKRTAIIGPVKKNPTERILNACTRSGGLPVKCPPELKPFMDFLKYLTDNDFPHVDVSMRVTHEQNVIAYHHTLFPEALHQVRSNSVQAGLICRLLSGIEEQVKLDPTCCFACGIFQNLGRLAIYKACYPVELEKMEEIQTHVNEGMPLNDAEYQVLGTDHAIVGAELMQDWGAPDWLCASIRNHNSPSMEPTRYLALAHLGGRLSDHFHLDNPGSMLDPICMDYFGMTPKLIDNFAESYKGFISIAAYARDLERTM